jgi:predicted nucleotide-binding protein
MAISQKDYRYRANQLLALDFEDATPRIVGFIEWLEADPAAAAVLDDLRKRDVQPLLDKAGHQRPPQAKTPEDVAAIGVAIIDNAVKRNTTIYQIGMAIGVRAYTSKIQDTSDEVLRRYIRPLLQYLESQVFESRTAPLPPSKPMNPKDVFVVHGRNESLRRSLFSFLRALGLNPLEWESVVASTKKGAPYIGEILDAAFKRAGAVVVLLTPDDEGRLRQEFITGADGPDERDITGQARGNVLFEAGMAFGHHADKTILVQIGKIRPFSDIGGRHVIHLSNDFAARQKLLNRLQTVGCNVDSRGTDWHSEGDFSAPTLTEEIRSTAKRDSNSPARSIAASLSDEAHILLREAALDHSGEITRLNLGGGATIQTNGKNFMPVGDPRAEAKWEHAMEELETKELIKVATVDREYFKITHLGYQVAESLEN